MRIVIQRVQRASVSVDGREVSSIGQGLMVLVGVETGDSREDAEWLAAKTVALRIFDDADGVMNRSVLDIGGEVLAVSQFTLTASTRKATGPATSAPPAERRPRRSTTPTASLSPPASGTLSAAASSAPT